MTTHHWETMILKTQVLFRRTLRFDPSVPVRDENGDYSIFPDMAQYPNPISLARSY